MPNLSQMKRKRMLEFLEKIKEEHKNDDKMLIALGEIESELNAKKYGLVWEEHEEKVDSSNFSHVYGGRRTGRLRFKGGGAGAGGRYGADRGTHSREYR